MLRVFQSVRGLSDDSVTRLDKNEDLALEKASQIKTSQIKNRKNKIVYSIFISNQ